jgi:hypothetical protein
MYSQPTQPTPIQTGADDGTSLLELTADSLLRIRKTDEIPCRVSIYDVIVAITGSLNPTQTWKRLCEHCADGLPLCSTFTFRGRGQQPIPVATAREIYQIIFVLPGTRARQWRARAADILVRYMGGDLTLIPEIVQNRAAQEAIPSDHPVRLFGETVEHESRVPAAPLEFHEAPHLEGGSHLYALESTIHPRLFKTGSGKDPWERLRAEEQKHEGRLGLCIVAIWWNEAHLEPFARRHLKEFPPKELGIKGTEYRMTSQKEIKDATDLARQQCNAEEERQSKRRKLDIEFAAQEFELEQKKATLKREEHEMERQMDIHKHEMERQMDIHKHEMERIMDVHKHEMAMKDIELEMKRCELEERKKKLLQQL